MLADLVSHRPLMPLLARLPSKVNQLPFTTSLSSAALRLFFVQTDHHPEMPLGKIDRIDGRLGDSRNIQYFILRAINRLNHFFAWQIVKHDYLPYIYGCIYT